MSTLISKIIRGNIKYMHNKNICTKVINKNKKIQKNIYMINIKLLSIKLLKIYN